MNEEVIDQSKIKNQNFADLKNKGNSYLGNNNMIQVDNVLMSNLTGNYCENESLFSKKNNESKQKSAHGNTFKKQQEEFDELEIDQSILDKYNEDIKKESGSLNKKYEKNKNFNKYSQNYKNDNSQFSQKKQESSQDKKIIQTKMDYSKLYTRQKEVLKEFNFTPTLSQQVFSEPPKNYGLTNNEDLPFYWFDCAEDHKFKSKFYLFGKVHTPKDPSTFQSAC